MLASFIMTECEREGKMHTTLLSGKEVRLVACSGGDDAVTAVQPGFSLIVSRRRCRNSAHSIRLVAAAAPPIRASAVVSCSSTTTHQ
jgi:hypothetical protein